MMYAWRYPNPSEASDIIDMNYERCELDRG